MNCGNSACVLRLQDRACGMVRNANAWNLCGVACATTRSETYLAAGYVLPMLPSVTRLPAPCCLTAADYAYRISTPRSALLLGRGDTRYLLL